MIKSSKLDLELLLQNITDNKIGIVLIEFDTNSFIDVLTHITCEDRHGKQIICQIFPIRYKNDFKGDDEYEFELTQSRATAVHNIFNRWCSLGYNKNNSKSPFGCKRFMQFLDEIGYLNADYLIFCESMAL